MCVCERSSCIHHSIARHQAGQRGLCGCDEVCLCPAGRIRSSRGGWQLLHRLRLRCCHDIGTLALHHLSNMQPCSTLICIAQINRQP